MDAQTLALAMGIPLPRANNWLPAIEGALKYAEISTRLAVCNFLAQVGHESGSLQYTKEIWGPTPAQSRYEGRKDLGNVVAGDGYKFRGRGLIQVTGRANYLLCSKALFGDESLLLAPEKLELPEYAALSAAWFWKEHSLNKLADRDMFTATTKVINGGVNGIDDRKARYKLALKYIK